MSPDSSCELLYDNLCSKLVTGYQMFIFNYIFNYILACAFKVVHTIQVMNCSYLQDIVPFWDEIKLVVILAILKHKTVICFIVSKCLLIFERQTNRGDTQVGSC